MDGRPLPEPDDEELIEAICENEKDFSHLVGK